MRPVIIGTAGHVDHGKTTLIRTLTGVDTDRLREEKERQLTIDLGFAPFYLPSGRRVGVIDVPGHEKFMGNMLAGIGGIDLVLLVIDANEGVMPQTREHLEVLDLLKIKKALVVLTKIDTADPDWLDLVEEEIREELRKTRFADAEMVRVSAVQGTGIAELKQKLDGIIDTLEAKDSSGPLRMPVDRSFKMKGFGTIVTGTLMSGSIQKDQQVEILPDGLISRVRNIEVHNESVDIAYAGQRVALNLAGVEKEEVSRGCLIAQPGFFQPIHRLDVELEILPDSPYVLKHASQVHFHLGTAEVMARVFLLGKKELLPGESAFAQLELDEDVVAHYLDRFIVRFFSPVKTIGGGRVLNVTPGFYRRYRDQEMAELELLAGGSQANLVLQRIMQYGVISRPELVREVKMAAEPLQAILAGLEARQVIFELGEGYLMADIRWRDWRERIVRTITDFHGKHHLQPGISKAEVKQVLPDTVSTQKLDLFLGKLLEEGDIRFEQHMVALAGFEPTPTADEERMLAAVRKLFHERGIASPERAELAKELNMTPEKVDTCLEYMLYRGEIVTIADGYYLPFQTVTAIQTQLVGFLQEKGEITLAEVRDLLGSSRKYTLPVLEYFDGKGITKRKENVRVLA